MALSQSILAWIFCIVLSIVSITGFEDQEFIGEGLSTLVVEHTLDSGVNAEFVRRGTIAVSSFKAGAAQFSREGKLTPEEVEKIKALAQKDGLYKIRVGSKPMGSDKMQYVTAFTKACALVESNLTDVITVNVDVNGNIIGVSLVPKNAICLGLAVSDSGLDSFKTTVEIAQTVPGPAPETQSYVQKLEAEKAEKQKGAGQDNRSFFAKYWMYLVPLFIFLMFASNADPQAGGGGR